jgi:hypothetical protein
MTLKAEIRKTAARSGGKKKDKNKLGCLSSIRKFTRRYQEGGEKEVGCNQEPSHGGPFRPKGADLYFILGQGFLFVFFFLMVVLGF